MNVFETGTCLHVLVIFMEEKGHMVQLTLLASTPVTWLNSTTFCCCSSSMLAGWRANRGMRKYAVVCLVLTEWI